MIRLSWITPPTYNPLGAIRLKASVETDLDGVVRRMTRTATLDGSAAVYDAGYSAADRVFDIEILDLSQDDSDTLKLWVQTYARLWYYNQEAPWEVAPESYSVARGSARIRLLVTADRTES